MKSGTSFLLLCCALIIAVTFAFTASGNQQRDQQAGGTWEHCAMPHDSAALGGDLSRQIVRLGNEGWQLICVLPVNEEGTTVKTVYYFKRPK